MSVDRLGQLRRIRNDLGLSTTLPTDEVAIDVNSDGRTIDVDRQLQLYTPIQAIFEDIIKDTTKLQNLRKEDATSTVQKQRTELEARINRVISSVMSKAESIKDALMITKQNNDEYAAKEENRGSVRVQIRANLYDHACRQFQEIMAQFTQVREGYKNDLRSRMVRDMKIVDPSKSDAEIEQAVDTGEATQIIRKALASDNLREVVADLKARNHELVQLQRNVETLFQLFKDLYTLIEMQEESLNIIEQRIDRSLDYVLKAEENLHQAKKIQTKTQKLKCCLFLFLIVVFLVVFIVVLVTQKSK